MRETAKTMLVFLCTGIILIAAIVANSKYEEWRAEKVAAEVLRQQEAQALPEGTQGSVTIYMNDGTAAEQQAAFDALKTLDKRN